MRIEIDHRYPIKGGDQQLTDAEVLALVRNALPSNYKVTTDDALAVPVICPTCKVIPCRCTNPFHPCMPPVTSARQA